MEKGLNGPFFMRCKINTRFLNFLLRLFLNLSMTKAEILAELKRLGEIDKRQRTPTWMKAFDLYNSQVAHKANKLSPSCGNCYGKLKAWLMS